MRILHTADWHLGKHLEGFSRMDEQESFLEDFIDIVQREEVDMVIIAGDIYDTSNPPARAEKMFYDALKKISAHGERLILVIAGNHDNPERLVAAGPLARDHGIIMLGTPKTVAQTGFYGEHKVIASSEGMIEVEINGEKAVILTIAYPSEKRLNEVLYKELTTDEEKLATYAERIQALFTELENYFREDTINVVVSHLFAMGSEEEGSERNIQLGGSYIIDGRYFPQKAQYIALGHIDKPQIVPGTQKRARYAGSPIHYNKKERHFQKKCFIVDLEPKKEALIHEVPLKVYKPIEVWQCDSIEKAIALCEENSTKECWTYLEIKTQRFIRENEIKTMKNYKKDIIEIMPILLCDEKPTNEITNMADKSFEDIFREFYKNERETEPDEELVNMLLELVKEDMYEAAEAEG